MTQFEIAAEINQCDNAEKAAFQATSLSSPALTILSNLALLELAEDIERLA